MNQYIVFTNLDTDKDKYTFGHQWLYFQQHDKVATGIYEQRQN